MYLGVGEAAMTPVEKSARERGTEQPLLHSEIERTAAALAPSSKLLTLTPKPAPRLSIYFLTNFLAKLLPRGVLSFVAAAPRARLRPNLRTAIAAWVVWG